MAYYILDTSQSLSKIGSVMKELGRMGYGDRAVMMGGPVYDYDSGKRPLDQKAIGLLRAQGIKVKADD